MRMIKGRSVQYSVAVGLLLAVFLLGGSARFDAGTLIVLRPLSVLVVAYGLWTLPRECWRWHRFLFGMIAAMFALTLLHLIPLPPSVWQRFASGGLLQTIDSGVGTGSVWRPLTKDPVATWNAFYSLFTPAAFLLLGAQLSNDDRKALLMPVLLLSLASAAAGLIQAAGLSFSLYSYNNPISGLLSNRNHQGVLLACIFPMLAVMGFSPSENRERARAKLVFAGFVTILLVPLVMVTGSRIGILLSAATLVTTVLFYLLGRRRRSKGSRRQLLWAFAGAGVIASVVAVTFYLSRDTAITRLAAGLNEPGGEVRYKVWGTAIAEIWRYFPFGSGSGSYQLAFQIVEPQGQLRPTYSNHAHNDWIEVAMTCGIAGMLLLSVAICAYVTRMYQILPRRNALPSPYALLGMVIISALAIASVFDYPLRTPLMQGLFVVAVLWSAISQCGSAHRIECG